MSENTNSPGATHDADRVPGDAPRSPVPSASRRTSSRHEFPAKVKIAVFERAKGCCESCGVRLTPGNVEYDHDQPEGLTRGDPTLDNCRVLCRACHRAKTANDIRTIAKAKRRQRRHAGIKKPRTITRWRRFNGDLVVADRERN